MYIVRNLTKNEVVIKDLHLTLRPGRVIDLDTINSREIIERSQELRVAIKKGFFQVVKKDNLGDYDLDFLQSQNEQNQKATSQQLKEMEERLREQLAAKLESAQPSNNQTMDISQIIDAIEGLKGMLASGVSGSDNKVSAQTDNDDSSKYEIDDDKAIDIHQRSINRLAGNAKNNISHKSETRKSEVEKNIDELDELF